MKKGIISNLQSQRKFFMNTISCFNEDDSSFKPSDEIYTVAQHIGHAAETYDWFINGAFGDAFDLNFDNYAEHMNKYTSIEECIKEFNAAIDRAIAKFEEYTEEDLREKITSEPMKGAPKLAIVYALGDHTAHHRGALSVYARLLGKTPKMPYV